MSDERRTTDRELIERFSKEPRVGDEPERMIGGPHEVTEQYRSEPERLKAVILDAMMNGEGTLWEDIAADAARAVIAVSRQAPPADRARVVLRKGTVIKTAGSMGTTSVVFDPPFVAPETGVYLVDLGSGEITRPSTSPPADLREQVDALPKMWHLRRPASSNNDLEAYVQQEAVLAVFAERERVLRREMLEAFLANGVYAEQWKIEERARLRERIEALPLTEKRQNLSTRDRTATEFKADVLAEFGDHPPGQ